MRQTSDDAPLTLSTEGKGRRRVFVALYLLFGAFFGGIFLCILYTQGVDHPLEPKEEICLALGFTACFLLACLAMLLHRGTCMIDSAGITQRPLIGKARSLRWSDVQRAFVSDYGCCLIGKRLRIGIPLTFANKTEARCAAERIESILKPDFDPPRRVFPTTVREMLLNIIRSIPKMLAVTALIVGWYYAGYYWLVLSRHESAESISIALILGWLFFPVIPFLPLICIGIYREAKGRTDYYWRRKGP